MAIINGTSGSDTLSGATGSDDTLTGGLGDDFYDFSGVFGNDLVVETSTGGLNDTIRILSDIPASVIRLVGNSVDDLYIIADGYGSIRLQNHLLGSAVESFQIGAGPLISLKQGISFTGSINGDALYGTNFNDALNKGR